MSEEELIKLYDMISACIDNTNLIGQDLKEQYDRSVNIEKNLALVMENQDFIIEELDRLKKLIILDKDIS